MMKCNNFQSSVIVPGAKIAISMWDITREFSINKLESIMHYDL